MNTKKLTENPIFAMSLSSKELFHSNFWGWLCGRTDVGAEYARIFFPEIKEVPEVKREQGHRDLTFWQNDVAYVIENKFKSIPNKSQLLDYQKDLEQKADKKKGDVFGKGILTGLKKPSFIGDPELSKWSFITYKRIGEDIVKIAKSGIETDAFTRDIIVSYGELIQELYEALMEKLKLAEKEWIYYDEDLANIRMNDIYSKLVASQLAEHLRENLVANKRIGDYELYIDSDYGQGGALVNVRYAIIDEELKKKYRNPDDGKYRLDCIGIQIEGNSYRWCASVAKNYKKYSLETDMLFDEIKKTFQWFVDYDYKKKPKMITDHIDGSIKRCTKQSKPRSTDNKKEFPYHLYTGSANNPYTFMYQFWTINDRESFDYICEEVQRDIDRAAEIIKAYTSGA